MALDIVYAEYETNEFIRQSKAYAEKCSTIVSPTKLTEVENRHHFDIMYDIANTDSGLFQQLSAFQDKWGSRMTTISLESLSNSQSSGLLDARKQDALDPVSYTHLTLPTKA